MDGDTISGTVVAYTCAFLVYGVMEVLGLMPQEIKSAGLTLTGIFGNFYGDLVSDYQLCSIYDCVMQSLALALA